MFRIQNWSPNSLEKKCLQHLDSPENWLDILKVQQPAFDEPQSWKPFWRIFIINITLFLIVFGFLFSSLEVGFGGFEVDTFLAGRNRGARDAFVLVITHLAFCSAGGLGGGVR